MATVSPEEYSWKVRALAFDGRTGKHAKLAAIAVHKGFDVEESVDKELTYIARQGIETFRQRVIGEIRGGDQAVVRITAKVD